MSADDELAERVSRVVPDAIRRRYLAKFAVGLLVVAVLTGAIGLYTAEQAKGELRGQVHHDLETVARLQADEMNQWHEERRQTVRMLSNDAVMGTDDAEQNDVLGLLHRRSTADSVPPVGATPDATPRTATVSHASRPTGDAATGGSGRRSCVRGVRSRPGVGRSRL